MRASLVTPLIVAAVLLMLWRPWISGGESSAPPRPGSPEALPPLPPDPPRAPASSLPAGPQVDTKRSPLADTLNSADRTIHDDLQSVQALLSHYRSVFRSNPTGSNREITNALAGSNPKLFAPLPRDHSSISPRGELVDRWETPFFFHNLSGEFMEVRSAGPDRKLWTDDDELLSNAPPSNAP